MYFVRMKRVTATDARKNWFRLLDEVVEGEQIVVVRNGVRILLSRDEGQVSEQLVDYRKLLKVKNKDRADQWGWDWVEPGEDLKTRDDKK